MNTQSIAQAASNTTSQLAAQTGHATQAAQSAVEPIAQHAIGAGQVAPSAAQSFVDAGQSVAIGQGSASQLLEQLDSISQSAAMSATQALQFLQGVLY